MLLNQVTKYLIVRKKMLCNYLLFDFRTCQVFLSVHILHKSLLLHPCRATSHRLLLFSSLLQQFLLRPKLKRCNNFFFYFNYTVSVFHVVICMCMQLHCYLKIFTHTAPFLCVQFVECEKMFLFLDWIGVFVCVFFFTSSK